MALVSSCASRSTYRDGHFQSRQASYYVQAPGPGWQPLSFSGNDLAWGRGDSLISVNSECEGHGDPSLEVLTGHLLIGFEDREILDRERLQLDGRGALRTRALASLDGVPVELEMVVLKKDGCVYDLIHTAPRGSLSEGQSAFDAVVSSFRTEVRR